MSRIRTMFGIVLTLTTVALNARALHRPPQTLPTITTCWHTDTQHTYQLSDSHIEMYPYFEVFNKEYLLQHELPDTLIEYRSDNSQAISGSVIKECIEKLLEEIRVRRITFTDFTVLQEKDFNRRKGYGLMVLKFKQYPFILKLFIETPEGLTHPFDKGFEPIFFFFMGGGVNRHLNGFTRIPNREMVLQKINESPRWNSLVDIPRKWFWIPPNSPWITITGTHIGCQEQTPSITIPGTYCIIAEEIRAERKFSIKIAHDRNTALSLCNYLDACIDPHINNFMIEEGTGKLIIIDTEHFPTLIGMKEKRQFRTYLQWYFYLATKCACDLFFRSKKDRFLAQKRRCSQRITFPI